MEECVHFSSIGIYVFDYGNVKKLSFLGCVEKLFGASLTHGEILSYDELRALEAASTFNSSLLYRDEKYSLSDSSIVEGTLMRFIYVGLPFAIESFIFLEMSIQRDPQATISE